MYNQCTPKKITAFSLVELSIVLVILGLLTGGILTGRSLIRAAELRSVTTDFNKYKSAALAFRDKYFYLPGDMNNATSFWGALSAVNDTTCQAISATGTATCNGNGDGHVAQYVVASDENFRFWQHLANAGLIEGQYTGLYNAAYAPGVNVPTSKLGSTALFIPGWLGTSAGTVALFAGDYGNYFLLTTSSGSVTTVNSVALLPEEAWNIDTKLDDGVPGTGIIMPKKGNGTNTNCTTFAGVAPPGDAGATYVLTNTNKDCMLFFVRVF